MKYLGLDWHYLQQVKEVTKNMLNVFQKEKQSILDRVEASEELTKQTLTGYFNEKKEIIEDTIYKVETWDNKFKSMITYWNGELSHQYGMLLDYEEKLSKLERSCIDRLSKTESFLENIKKDFSFLSESFNQIINMMQKDVEREEAREVRLLKLEETTKSIEEKMQKLSFEKSTLASSGKDIQFKQEISPVQEFKIEEKIIEQKPEQFLPPIFKMQEENVQLEKQPKIQPQIIEQSQIIPVQQKIIQKPEKENIPENLPKKPTHKRGKTEVQSKYAEFFSKKPKEKIKDTDEI
jgi:hypothetical protein